MGSFCSQILNCLSLVAHMLIFELQQNNILDFIKHQTALFLLWSMSTVVSNASNVIKHFSFLISCNFQLVEIYTRYFHGDTIYKQQVILGFTFPDGCLPPLEWNWDLKPSLNVKTTNGHNLCFVVMPVFVRIFYCECLASLTGIKVLKLCCNFYRPVLK